MSQFIFVSRFAEQLRYLIDYPVGSLLFLYKYTKDAPNNERFEVLMFELKTGKRKEYFEYFLNNPEFTAFYVYPNWDSSYQLTSVKREFDSLPTDESGRKFSS